MRLGFARNAAIPQLNGNGRANGPMPYVRRSRPCRRAGSGRCPPSGASFVWCRYQSPAFSRRWRRERLTVGGLPVKTNGFFLGSGPQPVVWLCAITSWTAISTASRSASSSSAVMERIHCRPTDRQSIEDVNAGKNSRDEER